MKELSSGCKFLYKMSCKGVNNPATEMVQVLRKVGHPCLVK